MFKNNKLTIQDETKQLVKDLQDITDLRNALIDNKDLASQQRYLLEIQGYNSNILSMQKVLDRLMGKLAK